MPDLLTLWERCSGVEPGLRAHRLLQAAYPETDPDHTSVSERDALLLKLRSETFGDVMPCRGTCPRCGCALEYALRTEELLLPPVADAPSLTLNHPPFRLDLRLPSGRDLIDAGRARTPEQAFEVLLTRCVVRAQRYDEPMPVAELPREVVEAVSERLAELDPQADLSLTLECPECRHGWSASLDIGEFVYAEIAVAAPRLLAEVDALARAYSWSERDILGMSPWRRQRYLELIDVG